MDEAGTQRGWSADSRRSSRLSTPKTSSMVQQSWTPAGRVAAVAGGALLAMMGRRRGGLSGLLMLAGGIALVTRGTTAAALAKSRSGRAIDLQKTIEIAALSDAVFAVWCRYENFPRFMSHVRSVSDLGNGRSHWIVDAAAGAAVEWNSAITRMVAGRLIEWRTEPGAALDHAGSVRFEPSERGTRVSVRMSYDAGGTIGHALASLLGRDPKRQMDDDLRRMKSFVESSRPPRSAAAMSDAGRDTLAPQPLLQPEEADVPAPNTGGPPMSGAAPGA